MAIQFEGLQDGFDSDLDFLLAFQNVLLRAVEGERGDEADQEYRAMRAALLDDPKFEDVIPSFVQRHRDLKSLWPTLKSFSPQWEPRRAEVRRQFESALNRAELVEPPFGKGVFHETFDSSAWTGAVKASTRLIAVRTLLPTARAAVEQLIAELEAPSHNGGPQFDSTMAAVEALRSLHRSLGEILQAAEDGLLEQAYNDGLVLEAARFAKRAAKKLRDDPMPYAISGLLLSILTACGFPGIGGFLSGVAANMTRKA